MSSLLSKMATGNGHGENLEYFDGWKAYDRDPYHSTKNPNGVIQMGLAENQLCFDLIKEWIMKNPQASICSNEGVHQFMEIANFQDYHGLPEFRRAVAKFMGKVRGDRVVFDPERVVMSGGATGANETIIFCLAGDGDAFLVPAPYYPAFNRDLAWRTRVKLIPFICESENNFQITMKELKSAYEDAQSKNIKVKGLILTSPSNPLGTVLDKETLRDIVTYINEKRIHLVCDEIYAATVFNAPWFTSVGEVISEMPHINRDLIHIIYSLSKDMGMPGFRVGIVYSFNDRVVTTARRMSSFSLVSSQTQHLLAALLSDDAFVGNFLAKSKERLSNRYHHLTRRLGEVGIGCLKSNAGLFVWMDLRHLLEEATVEGEIKLWRVIINQVKINVSPGSSFYCTQPGWFRVCFANVDDATLDVALQRITSFVTMNRGGSRKSSIKRKRGQMELSLNFSGGNKRCEESLRSPHANICSPRSPIPPSPLVKART